MCQYGMHCMPQKKIKMRRVCQGARLIVALANKDWYRTTSVIAPSLHSRYVLTVTYRNARHVPPFISPSVNMRLTQTTEEKEFTRKTSIT
jgi:hypothetical protein